MSTPFSAPIEICDCYREAASWPIFVVIPCGFRSVAHADFSIPMLFKRQYSQTVLMYSYISEFGKLGVEAVRQVRSGGKKNRRT